MGASSEVPQRAPGRARSGDGTARISNGWGGTAAALGRRFVPESYRLGGSGNVEGCGRGSRGPGETLGKGAGRQDIRAKLPPGFTPPALWEGESSKNRCLLASGVFPKPPLPHGPVAQLIERFVRNEEVVGLIPIRSTRQLSNQLRLNLVELGHLRIAFGGAWWPNALDLPPVACGKTVKLDVYIS